MSLVRGWNQIGNPYNVPISWNSVIATNSVIGQVELIQLHDQQNNAFVEGDIIDPFSGGFVWADETITVNISPAENSVSGRITKDRIAGKRLDADQWILELDVSSEGSEVFSAAIGMHPEASFLKDKFDKMLIPRFFEYTELYTTNENYFYPWFSTDIRPFNFELNWTFSMVSNKITGPVELHWDNSGFQNDLAQLWLLDKRSGRLIDMKRVSSMGLVMSEEVYQFEIFYSRDPSASLNFSQLILGDAFPNPASSETIIPVLLPQSSLPQQVDLSVFDLTGKKIATVAKGAYPSGYYEFRWNISENEKIRSGLYIYQIQIKNDDSFNNIQKKIIIR